MAKNIGKLMEEGLRAGQVDMYDEDTVWARYSGDKANIGRVLSRVLRTLGTGLPLKAKIRALSLGSGSEPQFRILAGAVEGGLYLLDIDPEPLSVIRERCRRQEISGVHTIRTDYTKALASRDTARRLRREKLKKRRVSLVTLHHSLYYCPTRDWPEILTAIRREILSSTGAIHAVMMAAQSRNPLTTTWLYQHFAGKFFGVVNDQDLRACGLALSQYRPFSRDLILKRRDRVCFQPKTFAEMMAVVWMILLYPNVHRYSQPQREEICEYVLKSFWQVGRPLLQDQDHLVVYRGFKEGLI